MADTSKCEYMWFNSSCKVANFSVIKDGELYYYDSNSDITELSTSQPLTNIIRIEITRDYVKLIFPDCSSKFGVLKLFPPGSQLVVGVSGLTDCFYFVSEGYAYDTSSEPGEIKLNILQFEKYEVDPNCGIFGSGSIQNLFDALLFAFPDDTAPDAEEAYSSVIMRFCTDSRHLKET